MCAAWNIHDEFLREDTSAPECSGILGGMSLEDEANLVVSQSDAKAMEAQKRKTLEATPVVPDWTSELVSKLLTAFPDGTVYQALIEDIGNQRTFRHEPLGRGWGIKCYWLDEGYKTGADAVLMLDGTLLRGGVTGVPAGPRVKSVGIPRGVSRAVVAYGPLINAFNSALPEAAGFRRIFGVCGVAAVMKGTVEDKDGGLAWWDTSRS